MPSSRASAGSATAAVNSRASTIAARRESIADLRGGQALRNHDLPGGHLPRRDAIDDLGRRERGRQPVLSRVQLSGLAAQARPPGGGARVAHEPALLEARRDRAQALAALHLEQHLGACVRARLEQHGDHGRDRDDREQQRGEHVARDPRHHERPARGCSR